MDVENDDNDEMIMLIIIHKDHDYDTTTLNEAKQAMLLIILLNLI